MPHHVKWCSPAAQSVRKPAYSELGYFAYKRTFWLLTGKRIDYGNFSLLPIGAVRRLAHMPELWNNLAAAIMRSRLSCVPSQPLAVADMRAFHG